MRPAVRWLVYVGLAFPMIGMAPADADQGFEHYLINSESGWVQCNRCGSTMDHGEQYGHVQSDHPEVAGR